MAEQGFLPCFSNYKHRICPLQEVFANATYTRRVKDLLSVMIDSKSPKELSNNIGGHQITPIRPRSAEDKKIINIIGEPENLYKIDYGNNPFRIYFGLSSDKFIYFYMVDTKHRFYN